MSGAIVSFSTMAVAGRAVSFELDTFELMLYRSLVGIAVVVAVAGFAGKLGSIRARRMGLHLVRNVFHFSGQNLWFFAITAIPLAQVFALEFTSPVWVALFAPLVLGERLTRTRLIAALLGFAGILIVARPGVVSIGPGQVAAALAALGFAGSALFTRRLTRTENVVSILFWLTVIQIFLGLFCAGIDAEIAWPSAMSWPWLVLIGVAGLSAHYCLTTALSLAPASVVMPMDFLRLPVIALVGWIIYSEPLDPWILAGGAVILGANWLNVRPRSVTNR
ncbi:Uncharacterized membrane protein [Palleronia marisminoris]|uniref:Riboflavin transporter n=2 Tax=Palleronia marisminoris TaxID=315423 RepID=A0A1Y5R9S5_9RHOB|nr:Uncharacterized membrane protein [Palleronia marisminoris]SLN11287.1 Riboflavin transporter [Palleronia marisminoris]